MSSETQPLRPVSLVLKLAMLAPLAVAAGGIGLALTLFSGSTDAFFAWRMSPVTATLIGGAYGGACLMLAMALGAEQWVSVRMATAASALFMLLMLGACLLGAHSLHLTGGAIVAVLFSWGWMAVHLVSPLIGLLALGAQWRQAGAEPPAPPRLPSWVTLPMSAGGTLLTLGGLLLYALPETAAPHWPWQVRALDVRVIGAWCLTFGVALLLSRREGELRRVRNGMAALVCTGVLGLIGLARYRGAVSWGSPGAWLTVLVLLAFIGLGASGAGISALLDAGESAAVRPAQTG